MTLKRIFLMFLVVFSGIGAFWSGVLVGQSKGNFKAAKYLKTIQLQEITLYSLRANQQLILNFLPMSNGISTPSIDFLDPQTNKLHASLFVSSDIGQQPLDKVSQGIRTMAIVAFSTIQGDLPDLKVEDFVLTAYRMTGKGREVFASYRNGNLYFEGKQ